MEGSIEDIEGESNKIVASIEDIEATEGDPSPEPVSEQSILKKKPKKPRSTAQKVAFAACQIRLKESRELKRQLKQNAENSKVKKPISPRRDAIMPTKKRSKKGKKTIIRLSSSSSEDENDNVIYISRKKRKTKTKRKPIVKYLESESDSDSDYVLENDEHFYNEPLETSAKSDNVNQLSDYYRFL